jgi:hypothetical protein
MIRLPNALRVLPALPLLAFALPVLADTVTQPADPPARRTVELQEVWRLGGDDENDPLLGLVTAGLRDEDGNTYLVDRQLSQVLVIGPDGELVTTLGREGDGPGEMRRPHGLLRFGGDVGVVQGFPGKVIYLAPDGTPAGETPIGGKAADGGFRFVRTIDAVGDRLVGATGRGAFDMEKGTSTTTSSLAVMDREGAVLATFAEHVQEQDFQKFELDERKNWAEYDAWCVTPSGLVLTAGDRESWRINVRDLEGNLVQVWEREFTTRRRTAEDKEQVGSDMRIVMNGRRIEPEIYALDTDAAIADLRAAADGRVFVRTCWDRRERLDAGTAGRFTVVEPGGVLAEELTLTFPGFDPQKDALAWLDGTHFLVLRNMVDAQRAEEAGFAGAEEADTALDAEPLEVVLVRIPA